MCGKLISGELLYGEGFYPGRLIYGSAYIGEGGKGFNVRFYGS